MAGQYLRYTGEVPKCDLGISQGVRLLPSSSCRTLLRQSFHESIPACGRHVMQEISRFLFSKSLPQLQFRLLEIRA